MWKRRERLILIGIIVASIGVAFTALKYFGINPFPPAKSDIKILSPKNNTIIDLPQNFSGSYFSTDSRLKGYLFNSRLNESGAYWFPHNVTLGLDGTWKTTDPVHAGNCNNPGFQEIYAILTMQTFDGDYFAEHIDMEWLRRAEAHTHIIVERIVEC